MASTNLTLTAIAVKRVSGKAQTNINSGVNQELIPSTIQTLNSTVFGEVVPDSPNNTWATHQFIIQSASDGAAGTVQLVEFALEPVAGTEYANNPLTDSSPLDEGDDAAANTYHAYALKLSSSYEADTLGQNNFDTDASVDGTLGTAPFANNYHLSGSRGALQIVPSFASSDTSTNNPYIPKLYSNNNDNEIVAADGIDWYLDPYSGILFVQDPQVVYPTQNNQQPSFVRAFIYTGKMQSSVVSGDTVSLNISDGSNGFTIANNATASFETGSGTGLTISSSNDGTNSTLTFELNDVISGSAGLIHISASSNNGADLGAHQTASFIDGGAGLTVRRNTIAGGQEIVIGTVNDDVEFNNGTFNGNVTVEGDVIAKNYIVSSSVTYMTQSFFDGSTIFGDDADVDTHQFTGSILLTGSTFSWETPSGNTSTVPLVYDAATGQIHTGSEYVAGASGMTSFHISASGGDGFDITNLETASLKSANNQLTIAANASTNEFTFTVGGGVVSGSDQILDGSGILSSSTQNFTEYSSSVETLISDATASITVNETNITELQTSASAGIYFSASVGGGTSIALTETASFIGGDGITVTNSNGEITIESDYGELDSALHISASDGNGTSIAYTATASFSASGPGLTATLDGSEINYDINANTLIEAVDTATVINITASYAESASVATSASYALSSSYAVTASYAENAGSVSVTEDTETTGILGVVFSNLDDDVLKTNGEVNENVTLKGHEGLGYSPKQVRLYLSSSGQSTYLAPNKLISDQLNTFDLLTGNTSLTTINVGTAPGTVYFQGSASIAGDLIVEGTTTTLNTANLLVEDRYILLASGSNTNTVGGGIIVERSAQNVGTALHWDETNDVWAVDLAGATAATATAKAIDFNLVGVVQNNGNPSGAPNHGLGDYKLGQMYVNTTDTDGDGNTIWIYAT